MIAFRARLFPTLIALLTILACQTAWADVIKDALDTAKANHVKTQEQVENSLTSAFDSQVKILSQGGDLDAVQVLIAQRKAFVASKTLPTASSMRAAVAIYNDALASNDLRLKTAYEIAVADYTKAERFDDAILEKRLMAERFPPPKSATQVSTQTPAATTAPGDPILDTLQSAKEEFVGAIKKGHTELLAVIEKRANDAADRGDLDGFKRYNALEGVVLKELLVPSDFKDTFVQGANAKFIRLAEDACAKLKTAYKNAISDYTKARRIQEAETIKAEMIDGGWFETFAGASAPKPTPASASVDLLRSVDIQKNSVRRGWGVKNGALESAGSDVQFGPWLEIPVSATGNYELHLQFILPRQSDGLYLLFPTGKKPALLEIRSGLQGIAGKAQINGNSKVPLGESSDAILRVSHSDPNLVKIELLLNGNQALSWQGAHDQVERDPKVWVSSNDTWFAVGGSGTINVMQLKKGF